MILEKIKWKNFLSYGQNFNEIPLNNKSINIIQGTNGEGKSTVIDVISFVFTGKPYRDIKKSQMINSTNKKGLYAECHFTNNKNKYIIKRGIKPNIFEIYKNDILLDQSAKIVDYQKILDDIIKIDLKTLKQSIIMSSKYYKPFLEMTKGEKRFYLEEILNIKMFGIMLDKVKSLNRSAKQDYLIFEKDIERIESNIILFKEMKEKHNKQSENRKTELLHEIYQSENRKDDFKNFDLVKLNEKITDLDEKYNLHKDKYQIQKKFENKLYLLNNDIRKLNKEIKFLKSNDICSTCNQKIDKIFKDKMINNHFKKLMNVEKSINDLTVKKNKIDKIVIQLDKITNKIISVKSEINQLHNQIVNEEQNIKRYKKEINIISQTVTNDEDKEKILGKEKIQIEKKLNQVQKNLKYYKVLMILLADDGIKRYIIQKYLNVFNSYVNKYLELLNTSYRIKFDDEFEESIVANGYEELQYGNFSGGERQRLDLAILFAFVELAKNRNSVNCNVLFLDEIADSALDDEGVEGMFKILDMLKRDNYTTYIISHREGVSQYCDNIFEAHKKTFSNIRKIG